MSPLILKDEFTGEVVTLEELFDVDRDIDALGKDGVEMFYRNLPRHDGWQGYSYEHYAPGCWGTMINVSRKTFDVTIAKMNAEK